MKTRQPAMSFQYFSAWLALGWIVCAPAFADLSSPFYRVESGRLRGGGAELDSALFSLEGGGVDFIQNAEMQGTQFRMETGGGPDGVQARLPRLQSAAPSDLARFFGEDGLSYTVTAQDPDGGALQYQLKQDGAVKIPFQAANILSCALTAADRGRRSFAIEVRDSDGTVSAAREAYVLRKPMK